MNNWDYYDQQQQQQGAGGSTAGCTSSTSTSATSHYPNTDLSVWLRSCLIEVKEPIEGILTFGKIPVWVSGSLIMNGPGGVDIYGEHSCKHLFDGPGLLQKFQVNNGIATYSSKFIETHAFTRNIAAQRLVLSEFGTVATPDPCQTIFARIAAVFLGPVKSTISDNANISIYPFGDEAYSLSEFPFAHRIDVDNLETIKTINVYEELGVINHSAHPHIWGRKLYNMGQKLSLWHGPQYIIAEMDTGRGRKSSSHAKTSTTNSGSRRPSASPQHGNITRSRSPSVVTNTATTSATSSVASSTTNLANLDNLDNSAAPLPSTSKTKYSSSFSSPWSHAKIVATIPSRWPLSLCYMHTFSITQNYFVLIEQPLALFLPSVPLTQISGSKPLASCLKFYKEEDTLFHVLNRHHHSHGKKGLRIGSSKSSRTKTFRSTSFFYLHTINAFEMRDSESRETFLVVDICCYNDPSMIDCMYVDALKHAPQNPDYAKMFRGRPKRFLLKLEDFDKRSKNLPGVESEMIVDIGCETPRINESFNGKPYNFFYAISSDVDRDNPGTLIKVDVLKKTFETWCEANAYPSEPIFIPRPNSQREDDGVVLSTVVFGRESVHGPNKTCLLILNATSWDLIAKIDFMVESAVPKSLHGWYFPTTSKEKDNFQQKATHPLFGSPNLSEWGKK